MRVNRDLVLDIYFSEVLVDRDKKVSHNGIEALDYLSGLVSSPA